MAEFRFRLASVMRYRERIQQEKQWDLALLNETVRSLEEQIDRLQQELAEAEATTGIEEAGIYSVEDLRLRGDYTDNLERRIEGKRQAIRVLDKDIEEKRKEVVEAMRGVKILDELRRRLEEKFRHSIELADQKSGDEAALRKFAHPDRGHKLP